jgi:hypothetical protein
VKSLHALLPIAPETRILFAPIAIVLAASACGGSVDASPQGSGKSGQMAGDGGAGDDASGDSASGNNPGPDGSTGTSSVIAVPLEECTPLVYKAGVTVGSQTFQMIIDTGSTTLGVASSKCTDCGVTPLYTPGTAAVDEGSMTTSQYGSGSWTGEIYQDSVGFTSDPTVPLKFAAITTQSMFFGPMMCQSGGGYQGIMGLDRAKAELSGTNAFFDQFVQARGIADVFATELCDSSGTLWLGGYDTSVATAAPQYTPFTTDVASSLYYTVDLESIAVDGASAPVAVTTGAQLPDTVVDTGTTALLLTTAAFTSLTNDIAASPGFAKVFNGATASWFSSQAPCGAAGVSKADIDGALPALTLTFGKNPGITIKMLPSESYLVPISPYGWCSLMQAVPAGMGFPLAGILGSPFLRSQITIFDRANSRVGFAPHTACN